MSSTHSYATLRVTEDMLRAIFPNEKIQETYSEFRIKANGSIVVNKQTSQYYDFVSGEGGNIVTLYAKENNISNSEAYKTLAGEEALNPVKQQPTQPPIVKKDFTKYAHKLYEEAVPISGTLAEKYLLNRWLNPMFFPKDFRYLENFKDKMLVAPLRNKQGVFTGIHRISLNDDATKIEKKSLAPVKGNGIWLTQRELLLKKLFIVEGLEDGLSVIQNNFGISVVATTGATFFEGFEVPEGVTEVCFLLDNDKASDKYSQAFAKKHESLYDLTLLRPHKDYKDFNEQLQYEKNSLMGVAYDH